MTRPDVGVFDVSRSTGLARHPDTMIHHAQSTYCSGMLETSTVCAKHKKGQRRDGESLLCASQF